jgi:hypothetical protein
MRLMYEEEEKKRGREKEKEKEKGYAFLQGSLTEKEGSVQLPSLS